MKEQLQLKNHLKEVRTEANLSQAQLAEMVGVLHIPQKQSTRSAGAERCSARNGSLLCWLIKLLAFL